MRHSTLILFGISIALSLLIFVFDLLMPLGVAGGVPYVATLLISIWLPKWWHTLILAVLVSCLTVLGFFFSEPGSALWIVLLNRALAIFVIWVTAFLLLVKKRSEAELQRLATHDFLTGLYNRNLLEQRIREEVTRASRYRHSLAVFMLDLDHFKLINDTFGHGVGDVVLRDIAAILQSTIRKTDFAARFGGEEFVVILPETTLGEARELGERLRERICQYVFTNESGKEITITPSIGIASYPEHAQSWESLLKAADSAMYVAKNAGRNQVKAL